MTETTASNDALIAFVVDGSGSMQRHRQATIDGFNEVVNDQREQEGDAFVTLTLFNSRLDPRYVAVPIDEVAPLGGEGNPYTPTGSTALLDAVGVTIKGTETWLERHPEFTGKVMVVIQTDGEENASREWHIRQPMEDGDAKDAAGLIKWKQSEGWQFIFLGAGGSAWLERTFGHVVAKTQFSGFSDTKAGYETAYRGVSANLTRSRVTGAAFVAPEVPEDLKVPEPV